MMSLAEKTVTGDRPAGHPEWVPGAFVMAILVIAPLPSGTHRGLERDEP
jgi:hypothetical protein